MTEYNIITATVNLIKNTRFDLKSVYKSSNRINSVGDALEEYIIDLFADSFEIEEYSKKQEIIGKVFSFIGSQNHPPDAMLKNGPAIEVKKVEGKAPDIQLNSSYPISKLRNDDAMITKACKESETWEEKDMIYAIGSVKENKLIGLTFVYGEDYAAQEEIYTSIKKNITNTIKELGDMPHGITNELGRINGVDPLRITNLRVRGMWTIKHPYKVFSNHYKLPKDKKFTFMAIINKEKWDSFKNTDELLRIEEQQDNVIIKDIKIHDPNNKAKLKDAKLITYEIDRDEK